MERSFYNEDFDFEQLIKQKSDQYKMYPSDKVWKGINASLHSSRRWYWLGLVVFLAGISYYAIEQLASGSRKIATNTRNDQKGTESTPATTTAKNSEAIILPFHPLLEKNSKTTRNSNGQEGLVIPIESSTVAAPPALSTVLGDQPAAPGTESVNTIASSTKSDKANVQHLKALQEELEISPANRLSIAAKEASQTGETSLTEVSKATNTEEQPVVIAAAENNNLATDEKRINWLQENAVYELTQPKLKRISWQIGITPTTNYRTLVGNQNAKIASDAKNIPIALNIQGNLNSLVKHRPAMGFELSSVFLYAVNKNLTFKTGVQFNYARYEIQAYSSNATDRATIALNNFYGTNTDSITTFTRLRNFGGTAAKNLQNQYFQVAVPVGLELVVLGKKRLQIAVAGTVQPTYILNRDNYLISTDYKNYTREPSLVRRWNMNSSVEAFVSYKVGSYKFQVGPQFRYQLLSTYDDKYPVKEFLKEYGVKLAISKTIH